MNNYHKIKVVINNMHKYTETIHGITEGVLSVFKKNVIKINSVCKTIVLTVLKPKENIVKIKSSPVDTSLGITGKLNRSDIKIKNDFIASIIMKLSLEPSRFNIINSLVTYLLFILRGNGIIEVQNTLDSVLNIYTEPQETVLNIENENVEPSLNIEFQTEEQVTSIDNPNINAAAWYFVRLQGMSGSLNSYYNQTIENTGREKVV